jgi:hypothetical protein
MPWIHKPAQIPEIAGRPVDESLDLLRMIDPRRDAVFGTWVVTGYELTGQQPPAPVGRPIEQRPLSVLLRYTPPPEFDLVLVASRRAGNGPLLLSMPVEMQGVGKLPTLAFGLEPPRNQFDNENPPPPAGPVIRNATPVKILIKIRPAGLEAEVAGVRVDPSVLLDSNLDGAFRHPDDVVFRLGSYASSWRISEFSMLPVNDTGETVKLPKTNIRNLGESQLQPGGPAPPVPPKKGPTFRELVPESGQLPVDPIRNLVPDFGPGGGVGKGFGKGFGKGKK